jgi:four helix bundle protein
MMNRLDEIRNVEFGMRNPAKNSGHAWGVGMNEVSAKSADLRVRTKEFALRVVRLVGTLPKGTVPDVVGKQLLRSATSVGANYRSACRGRSPAEFVAKLGIVEEEADEAAYWMEILMESAIVRPELLADLRAEADEIVAMVVSSIRTVRGNR